MPGRPPKPIDLAPATRVRSRKKAAASIPTASVPPKKTSLRRLGREIPTMEEFNQIDRDAITAHDRAVAILLSSQVERFLEISVISHFSRQDDDTAKLLVARDGPLASFYSKIVIAYAMGFISENEKNDLDKVRQIRNAFAHILRPITFKTEQIADLIDALHAAKGHPSPLINDLHEGSLAAMIEGYVVDNHHRLKFIDACRKLSLQILKAGRRH